MWSGGRGRNTGRGRGGENVKEAWRGREGGTEEGRTVAEGNRRGYGIEGEKRAHPCGLGGGGARGERAQGAEVLKRQK